MTILNSGRTHLSPFENGLREIVSDELQCAESTLVYIDFMVNVMNEFSGGPDDVDTVRRVMDSIAKFDPSKSGIISIHDFVNWAQLITKESLSAEMLADIGEGADIDGDDEFDYRKHVNLIASTLLEMNDANKREQFTAFTASASNGTFTLDQISMKMPLDLTGMSGEKSNTITLVDNTALTYVDYLLLLLQNQAHDLRNERPLMKKFKEIHPEGKLITPPDFMKWYKLNHERMVELKLCGPMDGDQLVKESFDAWMKIDVDGSGEIDYDEFIGAIVKQKIKNYL